ncbi:MAG: GNAT family N-acetyltransferase [candidate division NC10 bacterium]
MLMAVMAACGRGRDDMFKVLEVLKMFEMCKHYPKCEKLHDGTEVVLRLMVEEDQRALFEFFQRVPKEDRLFLRDDVSDPKTIQAWANELDYDRVLPLLALIDGKVVGDATLHRRQGGWTAHVGRVRLVVDPQYRQRGLGTLLIRELVEIGKGLELDRLVVELTGTQQAALSAFRHLGFARVAVLNQHIKDQAGRPQDLVIMINDLVDTPEIVSF